MGILTIYDRMINYKLKYKNTDFIVNEVSLMPKLFPKNRSQYTYLWLHKDGLTTFNALENISQFFNTPIKNINVEGLKDENAVTGQILSIKKLVNENQLLEFNLKYKKREFELRLGRIIGYGKNKVIERLLHGNLFNVTIRNLDLSTATKVRLFCLNNRFITFINYYDNQRFGTHGGPYRNHIIGQAIAVNNWVKVLNEIKKNKNNQFVDINYLKIVNNSAAKNYLKKTNNKKIKFFLSAYNSYLWNKQASASIRKHNNKCKKYYFEDLGKLYIPSESVFASNNILSIQGYDFSEKKFEVTTSIFSRTLMASTTVFPEEIKIDEFNKNKNKISLSFFLPTGSYATMLIKQIFTRFV